MARTVHTFGQGCEHDVPSVGAGTIEPEDPHPRGSTTEEDGMDEAGRRIHRGGIALGAPAPMHAGPTASGSRDDGGDPARGLHGSADHGQGCEGDDDGRRDARLR